ncbi:deoxyribodipyrimidine photo-lyase [Cyanobacterium stanieri LEGE 03274]|uniref:Deoxyribodipyrimidine photo-lyase n=1 Tax=Cyanobacterium stanieri LEGE 03274 TaxID=1828756 RepID=A0ABR9V1Y3_9CHRO|nr:FAD-binding domain-containing protein [Cyanobacterium stanieri]MBE9221906.1 deoxyribodipyrimidine photo-lyase [Cyanobacterium stanieri LEGE 03274]
MDNLILFWHRKDLRINDNIGLSEAEKYSKKIIGFFCLDPYILNGDDVAPARVKYMMGCLAELRQKYQERGGTFLIFKESPKNIIPSLMKKLQGKAIFWNKDVEPYSRNRDREIAQILKDENIEYNVFWDQLMHPPGDVLTKSNNSPYSVYGPFWRSWEKLEKRSPFFAPTSLIGLDEKETEIVNQLGAMDLPTAEALGYDWQGNFMLAPGENAALERLDYFCSDLLVNYDEHRNFPAMDGTSLLSAALKFGAIAPRTIWQKTVEEWENTQSDEARENITAWRKELAWREFYQHCLYFFPELAQGPYREHFKNFPWENDEKKFQAWCEGKTGYPIVDAAMRQLNETGWMHNRCRMIVASFLTKDLIIDWRWGEKYFMQKLYDGDLAANNGGWQWSASSGMDPKPLRIFNPASQAQKFDPEAQYIRQWLPEIRFLDTKDLVTGKITPMDATSYGYVPPIVDHKEQQRKFKALYAQVKEQWTMDN